jgi:hypothetical protein
VIDRLPREVASPRLARAYFIIQAAGVAAWWTVLFAVPASRPYFELREAPFAALGSFAPGDLALIAIGSVLVGIRGGRRWSGPLAWMVSGAMAYASCYVLSAALSGLMSPVGAALMIPPTLASITASAILSGNAPADFISPGSAT